MGANQHQQCGREKNGDSSYRRPQQSHDFIADECGADQNRPWSNLAHSNGVDELLAREPTLFLHDDLLYQRNKNETSPKQQHAHSGKCQK